MARVLLVEDDPDQLVIRRMILENAGHQVESASTAAQALELSGRCNVAVVDLGLPDPKDGLRLIELLRDTMKVIVLSGAKNADAAGGTVHFLRKPCSSRKLLETIARL
jgi:DNA-binding NtrC family response regulator